MTDDERKAKRNEYQKKWAAEKRAKMKAAGIAPKKYPNTDKKRARARAWKARNKERVKAMRAEYYAAHKEFELRNAAEWRKANPELYKEIKKKSDKEYRIKNSDLLKLKRSLNRPKINARQRKRYENDPQYMMCMRLRASLSQALRLAGVRKTHKTFDLIGCSPQFMMKHIESQFMQGMSWDNRDEWEVDHIRPCASFDLTQIEEQRKCFHYTNLRPLWTDLNRAKSDKLYFVIPDDHSIL